MVEARKWPDAVNALIGAGIAAMPWLVDQHRAAFERDVVASGLLLLAVALASMFHGHVLERWAQAALGAWVGVSPWALGFADLKDAVGFLVLAGLAVAALAAWALLSQDDSSRTHELRIR